MSKTVQSVKNSLKFKAAEKTGVLSVKVGVKKFTLPVAARLLSNGDYLFLSFTASSELYKVSGKGLEKMDKNAEAGDVFAALDPGKQKRGSRKSATTEISPELEAALKNLPAGTKLVFDKSGKPRLVKTRTRRAKA